MAIEPIPQDALQRCVQAALTEDRAADDITTLATVEASLRGTATFVAREDGIAAGFPVAAEVFRALDSAVSLVQTVAEGSPFRAGDVTARAEGPARALLQGERTALNFVQRLSGVATLSHRFAAAVDGTRAVILDTRKTTPGLRDLEKYAVRCGGGTNHRRDLAVMAMIKDNHREALAREGRTLKEGAERIRRLAPGAPLEIEIDSLDDLDAALAAKPEWILLDNMPPETMAEAVHRVAGRAMLEASGGVRLETVGAIAATGVDAISVGALTHSARALDISLELSF